MKANRAVRTGPKRKRLMSDKSQSINLIGVYERHSQMAARADCGRTLARSHGHFDTLLVGTEVGVLVDKTSETMAAVENRDQFHGAAANTAQPPTPLPYVASSLDRDKSMDLTDTEALAWHEAAPFRHGFGQEQRECLSGID